MIRIKKGDITIEIDSLPEITRLYDNQEVGNLFGKSERTIRRWKEEGKLPRGRVSGLEILLYRISHVPGE